MHKRSQNIYSLGCGRLWVVHGQWKLMFAHCMMQRKVKNMRTQRVHISTIGLVTSCNDEFELTHVQNQSNCGHVMRDKRYQN